MMKAMQSKTEQILSVIRELNEEARQEFGTRIKEGSNPFHGLKHIAELRQLCEGLCYSMGKVDRQRVLERLSFGTCYAVRDWSSSVCVPDFPREDNRAFIYLPKEPSIDDLPDAKVLGWPTNILSLSSAQRRNYREHIYRVQHGKEHTNKVLDIGEYEVYYHELDKSWTPPAHCAD